MMTKRYLAAAFALLMAMTTEAQLIYYKDKLYSPYAMDDIKAITRRQKLLQQANDLLILPIGSDNETAAPIETGLWNISQFMIRTPQSDSAVLRLINNYGELAESTQRALLEVVYGLYPKEFYTQMIGILQQSSHPKNFAIAAAYIFRAYPSNNGKQLIRQQLIRVCGDEGQQLLLKNLQRYIDTYNDPVAIPDTDSLFAWQQLHRFKMIYSFQRKNRDYPGLAVVQNADGSFVKDTAGVLRTFVQLARSASSLPWFITNGNTPQGLYAVTGTGISKNVFIGPTPNLQMVMMNEVNPPVFTHYFPPVFNATPERLYKSYFPPAWQQWGGLMEAFDAGKIGRSEIIAHGSVIDPGWYDGKQFYPLSPTMGCLSGREIWNKKNGKILYSDQLDLVNAFIETQGTKGYLVVINIDDKQEPVSPGEIEKLVSRFEVGIKKPGLNQAPVQ